MDEKSRDGILIERLHKPMRFRLIDAGTGAELKEVEEYADAVAFACRRTCPNAWAWANSRIGLSDTMRARLLRACEIMAAGGVYEVLAGVSWRVMSESRRGMWHLVTHDALGFFYCTCECTQYTPNACYDGIPGVNRGVRSCKHILAAFLFMIEQDGGWEY